MTPPMSHPDPQQRLVRHNAYLTSRLKGWGRADLDEASELCTSLSAPITAHASAPDTSVLPLEEVVRVSLNRDLSERGWHIEHYLQVDDDLEEPITLSISANQELYMSYIVAHDPSVIIPQTIESGEPEYYEAASDWIHPEGFDHELKGELRPGEAALFLRDDGEACVVSHLEGSRLKVIALRRPEQLTGGESITQHLINGTLNSDLNNESSVVSLAIAKTRALIELIHDDLDEIELSHSSVPESPSSLSEVQSIFAWLSDRKMSAQVERGYQNLMQRIAKAR